MPLDPSYKCKPVGAECIHCFLRHNPSSTLTPALTGNEIEKIIFRFDGFEKFVGLQEFLFSRGSIVKLPFGFIDCTGEKQRLMMMSASRA